MLFLHTNGTQCTVSHSVYQKRFAVTCIAKALHIICIICAVEIRCSSLQPGYSALEIPKILAQMPEGEEEPKNETHSFLYQITDAT